MDKILAYASGCIKHMNVGSYAAIVTTEFDNTCKAYLLRGGRNTKKINEVEILAFLNAIYFIRDNLNATKPEIIIRTDSPYILDGFDLCAKWSENDWRNSKGRRVGMHSTWDLILHNKEIMDITVEHVPLHSGDYLNDLCRQYAYDANKDYIAFGDDMEKVKEIDQNQLLKGILFNWS